MSRHMSSSASMTSQVAGPSHTATTPFLHYQPYWRPPGWSAEDLDEFERLLFGEPRNDAFSDGTIRPRERLEDAGWVSDGLVQSAPTAQVSEVATWGATHYGNGRAYNQTAVTENSLASAFTIQREAHTGQSLSYFNQTTNPDTLPSITCVVCMDTISDVDIIAPCGHHYDKDCILLLFERATEDESLFPPRCCSEKIPLVTVHAYMSADLLQRFREKSEEFSTLKRVYCANPACSHFLGPQQEFTSLLVASKLTPTTKTCTAPRCTTMTCMRCKSAVNGAEHWCVEDVQDLQILELGREAGWARCPGCKVMIERNSGCSHMSCRCGTQFCYCCGERWKTCSCGPYGPATRRRRRTARPRGVVQARQEPALPRSVQDDGLPQNLQSLMVNGRQESAPMLPVDARFVGIAANTENTSRQPAANLPTVSAVRYSSASLWAPPAPTLTTMLLPVVPSVQPAPAQYWFPPMPSPRQHPVHSELPPLPSIGELAGRDFAPAWTPTDTSSVVTSSSPAQPRSSRRRVAHLPTAIIPPAVSLTVRPEPTHLDHPYVHTTMMLPAAPSVAAHAQFGYSASQIMMMRAVASPARARYTHLGHPSSHAAVMPSVAAAEQQWTMR